MKPCCPRRTTAAVPESTRLHRPSPHQPASMPHQTWRVSLCCFFGVVFWLCCDGLMCHFPFWEPLNARVFLLCYFAFSASLLLVLWLCFCFSACLDVKVCVWSLCSKGRGAFRSVCCARPVCAATAQPERRRQRPRSRRCAGGTEQGRRRRHRPR